MTAILILGVSAVAGPRARHQRRQENRQERRENRQVNRQERRENRQDNRKERREERKENRQERHEQSGGAGATTETPAQ